MNIVIYGGRNCDKGYYEEIYKFIKKEFKDKSYHIITGGTSGVMDAVSKASSENSIKTTGVTLTSYKGLINKYVEETIEFDNEFDRMKYITEIGDIFLVFDGDIGTLEELFLTWTYVINRNKTIYIMSKKTSELINFMFENNNLTNEYKKYVKSTTMDEFKF